MARYISETMQSEPDTPDYCRATCLFFMILNDQSNKIFAVAWECNVYHISLTVFAPLQTNGTPFFVALF